MTPEQKIKWKILDLLSKEEEFQFQVLTEDNIDDCYDEYLEIFDDSMYDIASELREGEYGTGLPCEYSRHYESKSVASQMPDGSWVGWTYWYGGGKHGEPEAIDWVSSAYDLDVEEEEVMITKRTFTKKEK